MPRKDETAAFQTHKYDRYKGSAGQVRPADVEFNPTLSGVLCKQ